MQTLLGERQGKVNCAETMSSSYPEITTVCHQFKVKHKMSVELFTQKVAMPQEPRSYWQTLTSPAHVDMAAEEADRLRINP